MKKVNNLVVFASIITTGVIAYKVTTKVLGKLVPKKQNNDKNEDIDDYREIDLLDYENPKVERGYITLDFDEEKNEETLEQETQKKICKFQAKY